MRVILSIDSLHAPLTGIGWYTLELAKGLADQPEVESLCLTNGRQASLPLPEFLIDNSLEPSAGLAASSVVESAIPRVRGLRRLASVVKSRGQAYLCRRELASMTDYLCHGPNYAVPRSQPKQRNVATIHDLSVLRYPELHPARRVRFMRAEIPRTIARCERLIVSAQSVASELCEHYDVDRDRVSVVPLAARSVFARDTAPGGAKEVASEAAADGAVSVADREQLRAMGIPEDDFLLFVNGADRRKNFAAALRAFKLYCETCQPRPKLVVTVPTMDSAPLTAQAAAAENVVIVTYPNDDQLAALYRAADGLLYPSRYEGFGLPVVEALVAGTPVLVSGAEALLEFADLPGVVVVDPNDSQGFADGIVTLRSQAIVDAARSGAQAVANEFSWQKCVRRTMACYSLLE